MGETKGGERLVSELVIDALLDFLDGGLVHEQLVAGGYDQAEAERRRLVKSLRAIKGLPEERAGDGKSTYENFCLVYGIRF